MTLVVNGFLNGPLVTGGLIGGVVVITQVSLADPRQGTILYPDSDLYAVDPRMGSILSFTGDPYAAEPRQGTILSPDSDGAAVDPRQGTVIS